MEAFRAGGIPYRWWTAMVEEDGVVWTGKPYSLLEVYAGDGTPAEI